MSELIGYIDPMQSILSEWYGQPKDIDWKLKLKPWQFSWLAKAKTTQTYNIYINDSFSHENRIQMLATLIYHRTTMNSDDSPNQLETWADEMLCSVSSVEVLGRIGYSSTANIVDSTISRASMTEPIPMDRARKMAQKYQKRNNWSSNGYPSNYFETSYRIGRALESIVGWEKLITLASSRSVEAWMITLHPLRKNSVLRILGYVDPDVDLPSSPNEQITLGAGFRWLGNYTQSLKELESVARNKPNDWLPHYQLSLTLSLMRRLDEAILFSEKALALSSLSSEMMYELGRMLLDAGRAEEAMELFHRAMRLKPNVAISHYWVGRGLLEQKKRQEAIEALSRAEALGDFGYKKVIADLLSQYES